VLINLGRTARTLAVRTPSAAQSATLERLTAPGLHATGHVSLADQSFGARTTTGQLPGSPHTDTLGTTQGRFVLTLPAASAALLTVPN
jgi:hypothetical protein